MALRVVSAGECMLELARDGSAWRLGFAGDTFNTALYLARQGAEVRYFTALGVDPFSQEMLEAWREEGIDLSLVLQDQTRLPGLYGIRTDARGERSFYYWRESSAVRRLFELPGVEHALQAAAGCDLLYLSGITLSLFEAEGQARWVQLAADVRSRGGRVAFDPNFRPRGWQDADSARVAMSAVARHADFLLTTDVDELALWGIGSAQGAFDHWRAMGVGEVIFKQGAQGASAFSCDGFVHVPVGQAVRVVDTTGAGDAFNAAYLFCRLAGQPMDTAAQAGHRLAGQVVQTSGAIIPAKRPAGPGHG